MTIYDNAATDIHNIDLFANGPSADIAPRYGATYPSIRKLVDQINTIDSAAAASATAAAASATTATTQAGIATAAAASVPTGAGQYGEGYGPPGYNTSTIGGWYYDLANYYLYGPKNALGWPAGVYVPRGVQVSTRTRIDLYSANAAYPTTYMTFTRSSHSSDMLVSDPYDYNLSDYANDVPIIRAGKGLFAFGRCRQLLAAPGVPVAETLTLAAGIYFVLAWGPGGSKTTVTAGTGTATTGIGDTLGTSGVATKLTVSVGGTFTFTPSGGLTKANVQVHPDLATFSRPGPYISYQGIREVDNHASTAAARALFNTASGTFFAHISDVAGPYTNASTLLGVNSNGYCQISATALQLYDTVHIQAQGFGTETPETTTGCTLGFNWSAVATQDFGGGNALAANFPYAKPTFTSLVFFQTSIGSYGQQVLNGCVQWLEFNNSRFDADTLYAGYSSLKLKPVVYNQQARLARWEAIKGRAAYSSSFLKRIVVVGDSNVQSTTTLNDSFCYYLADLLIADGLPISKANWFGIKANIVDGVFTSYDGKLKFIGSTWGTFGAGFGRNSPWSGANGGTVVYVEPTLCDKIVVYYRKQPGAGSFTVNVDGGAALGAATSTNGTYDTLGSVTYTAALGAHTWNIVCDPNVSISGAEMYNSAGQCIMMINGGASAYQANNNAGPDWLDQISAIDPSVIIFSGGGNEAMNSTVAGETAAQYATRLDTMVTSITNIMNAAPNADRIICTESSLSLVDASGHASADWQARSAGAIKASMWDQLAKAGPIVDFYQSDLNVGGHATLLAAGYKIDYAHNKTTYKKFQAKTLHDIMSNAA